MYEKINITENHLHVLALFTKGYNREHYVREVGRLLGISPRTAQLILEDLEKKTVLESKIWGKIKTYKIKKGGAASDYFVLAEQYKKLSFLKSNPIAGEIINKITPYLKGMALVFGSYAKGIQKKGSDLDIFVAGTCDKAEVKRISETYGIDVSVKCYPKNIFAKSLREDILIREVLDSHIVFLNAEEFVRLVLKNGQA